MALPLQPGLTPAEIAFLCEMEMVTVVPRQRLESLELLGVSDRRYGVVAAIAHPLQTRSAPDHGVIGSYDASAATPPGSSPSLAGLTPETTATCQYCPSPMAPPRIVGRNLKA